MIPQRSRTLLVLCFCCGCWAFGFGLECPLASRFLQDAGRSTAFIGLNTGTHFFGVILTGIFAPTLIRRLGRQGIAIGMLLCGLGIALFPLASGPAGWFILRLLAGVGGALAMISLETLINIHAPPERRARDFACYACSVGIGFALGAFAGLHVFAVDPILSFVLGGCVTLAALPIIPLLPRFPIARAEAGDQRPIRAPFLSMAGAWCQGFLEAGMLALLPLYLLGVGYQDGESGSLLGGILIGVLLCQVPLGWLADHAGRQRVLIACFVVTAVGIAFIPFTGSSLGLPIALFVVGVCSGAFYPLGLALLGERLSESDLPRANTWYLSVNCFGSMISPLVSGPIMERQGPASMFWCSEAVIIGALLIWLTMQLGAGRRRLRRLGDDQTQLDDLTKSETTKAQSSHEGPQRRRRVEARNHAVLISTTDHTDVPGAGDPQPKELNHGFH